MNGSKQKRQKRRRFLHGSHTRDLSGGCRGVRGEGRSNCHAAVQMETQNFTAPENWITEDTTELTMDKMEAKRNEEIMIWLLKNIGAILSDLQPGTNATPYSREVRIGLVNALAAAQRDVYRMRYEMGSIKERADQALSPSKGAPQRDPYLRDHSGGAAGSFGEAL